MFANWETGIGLDVVVWLQSFENETLNLIAQLFATLGGDFGYLLLLPLLYWSVDRRLGRWLLVVLTLALFVIIGAKELFERPRPFILLPEQVALLITLADGYGFPSGHVGLSTAIWGFVALWARRWWGYVALAVYLVGMGWSRMYGGVHYPQDVIGGFILGSLVCVGLYTGRNRLASAWDSLPAAAEVALIASGGVLMAVLLLNDENGVTAGGILLGGGLGAMVEYRFGRFAVDGSAWQRGARFAVGLLLMLLVFVPLDIAFESLQPEPLFRVIRYALVSLLILGLYPLLMLRTGLAPAAANPDTPQSYRA